MSIDRWVLHGVLMRELDELAQGVGKRQKVVRQARQRADRLSDTGDSFPQPVSDCIVLGQQSDWDGLPPSKSLFPRPGECGAADRRHNLATVQQHSADQMDRFVKRNLRCRHYGRYVDDFYVACQQALSEESDGMSAMVSAIGTPPDAASRQDRAATLSLRSGVSTGAMPRSRRSNAFRRKIRVLEAECRRGELTYVRPGNQIRAEFVLAGISAISRLTECFGRTGKSPLRKFFDFTDGYGKSVLKRNSSPRGYHSTERRTTECDKRKTDPNYDSIEESACQRTRTNRRKRRHTEAVSLRWWGGDCGPAGDFSEPGCDGKNP